MRRLAGTVAITALILGGAWVALVGAWLRVDRGVERRGTALRRTH